MSTISAVNTVQATHRAAQAQTSPRQAEEASESPAQERAEHAGKGGEVDALA